MLSPEYLRQITDRSEEIAGRLHDRIIKRMVEAMMIRLGRGDDYLLTASDVWRIGLLQEAGFLYTEIQKEIAYYTRLEQEEIKKAFREAGAKALEADAEIYAAAGISTEPLNQSPVMFRIMERCMKATNGEWNNFTRTTADAAQKDFINACDNAYMDVMSGSRAYNQVVADAVEQVASNGANVFYPTGHVDTLETATARAVRTGISQTAGDISIKRMEEIGWDIILVSAHVGARTGNGGQNAGNHHWWQGEFYSRTGKDKRFPPFSDTGYGTGEGLCGWNCRHSFGSGDGVNNPYADLVKADNEDAGRLEAKEKKQRYIERTIRKKKRELQALKTAMDQAQDDSLKMELSNRYDQKKAEVQNWNKKYKEYCEENDLRPLQERLKIARS